MLADVVKNKKSETEREIEGRNSILSQLEETIKNYKHIQINHMYIHFKFVLQGKYNIGGDKLLIWLNDDPEPVLCIDKCWDEASTEFIDYIMEGQGFHLRKGKKYLTDGINTVRTYYL